MVLLRKVIGDALRARRLAQHRTLREVSTAANVSLGYLSEIERGHKEASSELLASICDALGARLSEMLGDVSATFALAEQMEVAFATAGADQEHAEMADGRPTVAVSEGDLTVQVHSDGPLRTTLTAMKRTTPPQRNTESVYAA
jgi:transcriptional regulator with XRE-family HTH domain